MLREMLYPEAKIEYEAERTEELRNSIADITAISRVLGYQPRTDLLKQIPEVIESLRKA